MKKFTLLCTGLFAAGSFFAQQASDHGVIYPSEFHVTIPISEMPQVSDDEISKFTESRDRDNRIPQAYEKTGADGPEYGTEPGIMQKAHQGNVSTQIAVLQNFAGQTGNAYPPDPTGAVGLNNYVQIVNATFVRVFSKTGTVQSTITLGNLWSPPTANWGDPIALYDKYADKWFLAQFGQEGSNNMVYIALSQTGNPSGSYWVWKFTSPQFPDYLKFSVWWDGYYMTSNQSTQKVFAFERSQMIAGNASARSVYANFNPPKPSGFFCPMPADADGQLPPNGTACPIFSYSDNGWGGGNIDAIQIYKSTVTWGATPTMTNAFVAAVSTAAFDGSYDVNWNDISQPGTTQKLDGIGGILQFRAQWRKWVNYNSVVLAWPVKISATQRSVMWCELHQNQGTGVWSMYQQGVYTPDNYYRWMGNIAMDGNGNIALCYAKSGSSTIFPSLGFTARCAGDALGQMSFAETIAQAGTAAQSGINRYGDYCQTTLDPTDDLTFWHTGEYIGGGGSVQTRVYSFKITPCSVGIGEIDNQPSITAVQSGNVIEVSAVNLPTIDQFQADLFDIEGREISSKKVTPVSNGFKTTISTAGLAKGTYLVRVGADNFQRIVKLVIN